MGNNRSNFSVGYQTKIVGIYQVNLVGSLSYSIREDESGWYIVESHSKVRRSLDEWLNKFEGKNVRILIEAIGEEDDTELLEGEHL